MEEDRIDAQYDFNGHLRLIEIDQSMSHQYFDLTKTNRGKNIQLKLGREEAKRLYHALGEIINE